MRCLVTGGGGFLGSYLVRHLAEEGHQVTAAGRVTGRGLEGLEGDVSLREADLLDKEALSFVVAETRPEAVFHLAAQSLPGLSWKDPKRTFDVNINGTLHILEAVRSAGLDPVVEVMCSSAEYSPDPTTNVCIAEDHPLEPSSPYALSKIATNHLCTLYHRAYGMRTLRVRPFLAIGPGKVGDASSDFARAVVAVERGQREYIEVGNLEAVRDFVDVRDATEAFALIAREGSPGTVYNVCSGRGRRVREILDILISFASVPVEVRRSLQAMRPLDEPVRVGDPARIKALGWAPRVQIEQTLEDTLDYWRAR